MSRVPVAGWLRVALALAGVYNLVWGTAVVLWPDVTFRRGGLATAERPLADAAVWQCLGMVVGVYGVGYLIAARDPVRHWPIVLVGLLGKLLGPLGYLLAAARGGLPWTTGYTLLFN